MTPYAPEWPQITPSDHNPQETPNDLEWPSNELEWLELLRVTPNNPEQPQNPMDELFHNKMI